MRDIIRPLHSLIDTQRNMPQADERLRNNIDPRQDEQRKIDQTKQNDQAIQPRQHARLSREERLPQKLTTVLMKKDDDGEDRQQRNDPGDSVDASNPPQEALNMRRENERPSRRMCSAIEHADGQRSDQTARSPAAEIGIEPGLQSLAVEEDAVGIKGEVIDRGCGRVIVELFADPSGRTRRQSPPPNILCGQGYLQVAVVLVFFLRTPQGLNARCGANATMFERLS